MTKITIFTNDFRLKDNLLLSYCAKNKDLCVPLFIYDDEIFNFGGAPKWWLYHSLISFNDSLNKNFGASLIIKKGKMEAKLEEVIKFIDAKEIVFSKKFNKQGLKIENKIIKTAKKHNISYKAINNNYLFLPDEIKNNQGDFYKVYTPFSKKAFQKIEAKASTASFDKDIFYKNKIESENIENLNLIDKKTNWSQKFNKYWRVSEDKALEILDDFLDEKIDYYAKNRDFPSLDGISKMSAYLSFGQISPRTIIKRIFEKSLGLINTGQEVFIKQILWREFCNYSSFYYPDIKTKNIKPQFDNFLWENDKTKLKLWKDGKTGFPIVDAGMRELDETGFMHNRVRMIVASFLTKDLFVDWRFGEQHFADYLVDYDYANNSFGWQWVAGSGLDAQPFFRIFNPTSQGEKFDKTGDYIRKWIPELKNIDNKNINTPHNLAVETNYPKPIIDHKTARKKALSLYEKIKKI